MLESPDRLYEFALSRTLHYSPREITAILLNFDSLWVRWFGVQPTDQQREAFGRALRTHLGKEAG